MNRLPGANGDPVTFNSVQGNENNKLMKCDVLKFVGNIKGEMSDASTFGSSDYEGGPRISVQTGSTALYQRKGSRYDLALGNG
ncbi:hypothetical protein FRC07_012292 [Ceratobasidium sp. 392]|nr:hypothetical protein FRC07_012292 [Ceratobasidium sp. 392]